MKRFFLPVFVGLLLASTAQAATCTTSICKTDGTLSFNSGSTLTIGSGAAVDTSGMTYSSTLTANPLLQSRYVSVTTAQANAVHTILASATGKKIYPGGGFSIYASGTASGATSVSLRCSGGDVIATFPIAMLTNDVPVGPFSSAGGTTTTRGVSLTEGCPSGEAVQVSSTGTLSTTTHLLINLPYSVQ